MKNGQLVNPTVEITNADTRRYKSRLDSKRRLDSKEVELRDTSTRLAREQEELRAKLKKSTEIVEKLCKGEEPFPHLVDPPDPQADKIRRNLALTVANLEVMDAQANCIHADHLTLMAKWNLVEARVLSAERVGTAEDDAREAKKILIEAENRVLKSTEKLQKARESFEKDTAEMRTLESLLEWGFLFFALVFIFYAWQNIFLGVW